MKKKKKKSLHSLSKAVLTLITYPVAQSVGVADLRTGGRWFEPSGSAITISED